MNNFIPQASTSSTSGTSPATATAAAGGGSPASAFSFISKGWREVRDSADADLRLMRDRANSFKNLASSFDRELENFINSASSPFITSVPPAIKASSFSNSPPPMEIEFVKKLQPKLSEFRRVYSSPDFSRKVLEKWPRASRPRIGIDLSAIRNAIVEEVEVGVGGERVRMGKAWKGRVNWEWKGESGEKRAGDEGEEGFKDWEPIRVLRERLKDFEVKKSPDEIFAAWKNSELVEKFKSSLV